MQIQERASVVAGVPFRAAKVVLEYGVEVLGNTRDVFLPKRTPEDFVADLSTEEFDREVRLAKATYEAGRQKKDPELGFFGGGWLMKLICRGMDEKSHVPKQKVDKLASYVIDEQLDPALEPCLSDEQAVMVADILRKKQPVIDMFPGDRTRTEAPD
jgi:hypothetical protein